MIIPLIVLGCIWFPFLAIGVYTIISYLLRKRRCTEEVDGMVVEFEDSRKLNSSAKYTIFQYYVDGITYTQRSKIGSSNNKYRIDEEVTIYYNPTNPNEYIVKNDRSELWFGVVYGLGPILIIGFFVIVSYIKMNFIH